MSNWVRRIVIGLSCLVLLALPATPASAVETLTVNELGDASDLTPGDGVCDSSIVLLDQCTLRAAIEEANALANSGGPDQIHFNIPFPEVAPHTIPPASPLPDVTEAVIIDAATEPDFLGTPVVELDGTSAGTVDGLRITAGGSTVRGLAIHSFEGSGISLQTGGGNTIVGNRIGTNVAGTAALANLRGVEVIFGSSANTIGGSGAGDGNVISGNTQQGVRIAGSGVTGNAVQGNLIGTDAAGTAAVPNGTNGVEIGSGADGNTVGGSGAGEGNVISGNATGVLISSSAILGNAVQGNLIGTDDTGLAAIPNSSDGVNLSGAVATTVGGTTAGARNVIAGNGSDGIDVAGGSGNIVRGNYVGVDATGAEALANAGSGIRLLSGANGNTIGGTAAGAGNVISGNTESGVWITGSGSTGNVVEGNRIGTDAAAAVDQGNVENGVRITGAPSNKIGGTALGEGNVISGNDQNGVRIDDAGATGNTVEGNWIGTNDAGASLGNGLEGVFTINGAEGNAIGGADPGAGNVIAFNGANGVQPTGTGNPILGNSIDSNVELGIDLPGGTEDAFGVTQNDAGDADVGANDLQNHPVISWVAGGSTAVAGKLSSEPNSSYRLEFFSSPGADHRCSVRERRSWAPRW